MRACSLLQGKWKRSILVTYSRRCYLEGLTLTSIYRKRDSIVGPERDVHTVPRNGGAVVDTRTARPGRANVAENGQGDRSANDFTKLRRAQPTNVVLPVTRTWLRSFPDDRRPYHLAIRFARIANQLAAAWRDRNETMEVIKELLIDRRGGRKGFPPEVQAELVELFEYVCNNFAQRQPPDLWHQDR